MVRIVLDNAVSNILGNFHTDYEVSNEIREELRNALAYQVSGAEWSEKYKEGTWDGKISLYNKRDKSFPTGLLFRVKQVLQDRHVEFVIENKREKPETDKLVTTAFEEHKRTLRPYQELVIEAAKARGRGVLSVATGGGKALCINTPILTANRGWVTMGEIETGDIVFDDNGNTTRVLCAHSVLFNQTCYDIEFSDGSTITADAEHLWNVKVTPGYSGKSQMITVTTQQMLNDMRNEGDSTWRTKKRKRRTEKRSMFYIDRPSVISYPSIDAKVELDPYLLGCWLGDGGTKSGIFTTSESHFIDAFAKHGFILRHVSKYDYYVKGMRQKLREIGVWNNKHVPEQYLRGNITTRQHVLAGIIDTDGHVDSCGRIEITLCNERLAKDVVELCRSLGAQVNAKKSDAKLNKVVVGSRWRIKISPSNYIMCLLPRKSEKINYKRRKTIGRVYVKSINERSSTPVRCITVDSPSKLYLAGETLIPTHNTMISAELIAQLKALPVVFIVPSKTLMHQTRKEFHKYLRIDGEKTKIGIAGDSICDLNPDGINILTWQTALQAFDEKYTAKGDKVVYDEFTGLQVRKTKAQLIDDVNDATRKLKQAEESKGDVKSAKAALRKAQTRLKNREQQLINKGQIKQLIRNTPVFIVDEAHTAAIVIQRLGEHAAKSYYRFGVTATAWREDNQEIRIEGTFGRILINIRPSDLIRDGWLVKPYIFMVKIKHIETHSDYNDAYFKHVVNCWERNYRIKQFAEGLFAAGRKVLILVERLEHGEILEQMVYDSVFVPGKDDGSGNETITEEVENYRLEMLARCGRGEHILIATQWANVGVDEPAIDSLILAGSNRSSVTTFQQVGRILRPAEGKENAIVIDFSDEQDDLHDHSLKRKRAYALEPEFKVYRVQ